MTTIVVVPHRETLNVTFYIFIQQICVLYNLNMVYTLRFFFPLQNAVCFINLTYLVPVLFTFNIQGVLKLKKNIPCKDNYVLVLSPIFPDITQF